jgi:hypothetical protein
MSKSLWHSNLIGELESLLRLRKLSSRPSYDK